MDAIVIKKFVSSILIFSILFSNFSFVFAQEGLPQRHLKILREIDDTISHMEKGFETLNQNLLGCACSKARSVCYGGRPGGLFSFLSPFNKNKEGTLCSLLAQQGGSQLTDLQTELSSRIDGLRESLSRLDQALNSLPNEIKDLSQNQIDNIKNQMRNLEGELNKIQGDLKLKPEELKNRIDQSIKELEGQMAQLENAINSLKDQFESLPYYLKQQFEQNIKDSLNEIERIYDEQIKSFLDAFKSFKDFLKSFLGCYELPVTGDPFSRSTLEKIKKSQSQIVVYRKNLSFLKELLKKEMETGLRYEVKDPEFSDKLDQLYKKIERAEQLADEAENIKCSIDQCASVCVLGTYFQLPEACFGRVGQQKPIKIIFEVGVQMPKEWKLGEIGVKGSLNLPKIQLNPVLDLKLHFHPRIEFPKIPVGGKGEVTTNLTVKQPRTIGLKFTCPEHGRGKAISNLGFGGSSQESYLEASRYFNIFSYLSGECQNLPEMKETKYGVSIPKSDSDYEDCFNPERVISTIINACNKAIEDYCNIYNIIEIIGDFYEIPSICQKIYSLLKTSYCNSFGGPNRLPFDKNSEKIKRIKEECENEKREDPSEKCKLLPVMIREFPLPKPVIIGGGGSSPSLDISSDLLFNFPSTLLGCGPKVTLPRLKLPKIALPDFNLGEFKIPPFLYIHLPRITIEDLNLNPAEPIRDSNFVRELGYEPAHRLCDLNQCLSNIENIFPQFAFKGLFLRLPEIRLPPIEIGGAGQLSLPWLKISLGDINFPTISFPGSILNFGKLLSLSLTTPSPKLPLPSLFFRIKKIEIDIKGIILAMIKMIIGKLFGEFPSLCISFKFPLSIPLVIDLGDYYLYFPVFHQIRGILGNIICQLTGYCNQLEGSVEKVIEWKKRLEDELNREMGNINESLEKLSKEISKEMEAKVSDRVREFQNDIQAHINSKAKQVEGYYWEIPPFEKDYGDIGIREASLVDLGKSKGILPSDFPKEIDLNKYAGTLPSLSWSYPLPPIDLSRLSYSKEIPISLGSFQTLDFKLELPGLSCNPADPSGKSYSPPNIGELKQTKIEISKIIEDLKKVTANP